MMKRDSRKKQNKKRGWKFSTIIPNLINFKMFTFNKSLHYPSTLATINESQINGLFTKLKRTK